MTATPVDRAARGPFRRTPAVRVPTSAPGRAVVPTLALLEARRLMLHPLTVAGFGLYVWNAVLALVQDQGARNAFETVAMLPAFFPGVFLVLCGTLLAGRDVRAGSSELLGPLPGRAEERVQAWLLAALAPALVALVLASAVHIGFLVTEGYATHDPQGVPGPWHLLTGPVTLWGAVAFGVMVGVWAPSRVTGLLAAVVLVVTNVALGSDEELQLLGTSVAWGRWGLYADEWDGVIAGSPALHLGYLVSLSLMAAAAAWVRVADRRGAPVLLGLLALGCAVATGLGQLP